MRARVPTEIFFRIYDAVSSYVSFRTQVCACVLVYKCFIERNATRGSLSVKSSRTQAPEEMPTAVEQDADNRCLYDIALSSKKRIRLTQMAFLDGGHL